MASFRRLTVWGFALVAIALLFILFPSPAAPKPYSHASNYGSVEGLEGKEEEEEGEPEEEEDAELGKESFEFGSMFGGNTRAKSEGYTNLQPSVLGRDSEIIDKFSQVPSNGIEGQNGCVSSGLTNSGGYICLTPELFQLLKTRGGNATGKDSQIGAPVGDK